jgi:hypothetical protein
MLKLKMNLVPFGLLPVKDSWTFDIWNDGTGNVSIGNYKFKIYKKNSDNSEWKTGEIKNFQRLKFSAWYLVYLCLKQIYE